MFVFEQHLKIQSRCQTGLKTSETGNAIYTREQSPRNGHEEEICVSVTSGLRFP
jgi:hypothetical protein